MGLMQFLSVGRSLGRISDAPNRYKMTQQNLLPKFGTVKPETSERGRVAVASHADPSVPHRIDEAAPQTGAVPEKRGFRSRATGCLQKLLKALRVRKSMQALEVEVADDAKPAEPAEPVGAERAFPRGRWTGLADVPIFRNPFARTAKAKESQPPVQTELRLEAIKPVRNDLTDCDLEVVAAGPGAKPGAGAVGEESSSDEHASADINSPQSEPAWERIKAQFLGAGKP